MEGILVVEPQMRVEELVLVDLARGARHGKAQGADGVPDADEPDLRGARILGLPLLFDGRVLRQRLRDQRSDRRRSVDAVARIELLDRQRRAQPEDTALAYQAGETARRVVAAAEAEDEDLVAVVEILDEPSVSLQVEKLLPPMRGDEA